MNEDQRSLAIRHYVNNPNGPWPEGVEAELLRLQDAEWGVGKDPYAEIIAEKSTPHPATDASA